MMKSRRNGCAGFAVLLMTLTAMPAGADDQHRGWGDPCRPGDDVRSAAIHKLYEQRDQTPIWLTRNGKTQSGRQLVRILRTADEGVMTDCLAEAFAHGDGRYSRGALDVMLTDAYLELSQRRAGGGADVRDHVAALAPGEHERLRRRLDRLAGSGTRVDQPEPDQARQEQTEAPQASATERMVAALERYRRIAERGGWPQIGAGPALKPGGKDSRVPVLRERLAASGDLDSDARDRTGSRYEGALVNAVIAFQERHGLEPDGVVGTATREALDVSARKRVARMETNLRRIEAHAIDGSDPVVRVNIPDFRVTLHEQGRVTFSTRAIVGRPEHATPELQNRITALTLNPPWNVPRTIVRESLADRFARDDGYAARHGFHAANSDRPLNELDWRDNPMVAVRQKPGPSNALGQLKFEMPNRRAIYLHDTPEKHLFESRQRAFSAGCVRVEEPMELASRLTGMDAERLERMADNGETRTLRLGWQIPVQLVYFTAWVDASGRVQFRPDIYNRDGLERAMPLAGNADGDREG